VPPTIREVDDFSGRNGAFANVDLSGNAMVVLQEPLQRRHVGVELGRFLRGRRSQKPTFATVQRLGESGPVEVERNAAAGSGQPEAQRVRVAGQAVGRQTIQREKVLPLLHVVVAEEIIRLVCKSLEVLRSDHVLNVVT